MKQNDISQEQDTTQCMLVRIYLKILAWLITFALRKLLPKIANTWLTGLCRSVVYRKSTCCINMDLTKATLIFWTIKTAISSTRSRSNCLFTTTCGLCHSAVSPFPSRLCLFTFRWRDRENEILFNQISDLRTSFIEARISTKTMLLNNIWPRSVILKHDIDFICINYKLSW